MVYHRDNSSIHSEFEKLLCEYFNSYCKNYKNISKDNFIITNGSEAAIDIIMKTFCSENDLFSTISPTYTNIEVKAKINCNLEKIVYDHRNRDINSYHYNGKVIYIVNPNMPFGYCLYDEIHTLIKNNPNKIIVVDEAYAELSAAKSFIPFINLYKNLIVIRSMSKGFGLPGIRIGYCIFNNIHRKQLLKLYSPRNLQIISVKIGIAVLRSLSHYKKNWQLIRNEYVKIKERLSRIVAFNKTIFHYEMGDAPFYFIYTYNPKEVAEYFYKRGFIVREKSSEIPFSIRISVSTPELNNMFLDEIELYNSTFTRINYIDLDNTLRIGNKGNDLYRKSRNIVTNLNAKIITNNTHDTPDDILKLIDIDCKIITPLTILNDRYPDCKFFVIGNNKVKKYLQSDSNSENVVLCSNIFLESALTQAIVTKLTSGKKIYTAEVLDTNPINEMIKIDNSHNLANINIADNGIFLKIIKAENIDFGKTSFIDNQMGLMIGDTLETDGFMCFNNNGLFIHILKNNDELKWNGKYFTVGNIDILYNHIAIK